MTVCNVGKVDRYVRAMSAVVLIAFALVFVPTSMPKIILLTLAVLLLLSAWFGVCYVYQILGLHTSK